MAEAASWNRREGRARQLSRSPPERHAGARPPTQAPLDARRRGVAGCTRPRALSPEHKASDPPWRKDRSFACSLPGRMNLRIQLRTHGGLSETLDNKTSEQMFPKGVEMDQRLARYEEFMKSEFFAGLLKPTEYSIEDLTPALTERITEGSFRRIVFVGMGCSAIVSDVLRGYFNEIGSPIDVFVLNDYEVKFLLPPSALEGDNTLFVVSSYSGNSDEPLLALDELTGREDQTLILTSGSQLAEAGKNRGISIAHWRLAEADREYPLFHVPQYFAILLHMFHHLGFLPSDGTQDLQAVFNQLTDSELMGRWDDVDRIARDTQDANIILLGSPKWHESLFKLGKMHFNEMAMAPTTRNLFHEFCHSEVATLSEPARRHCILLFSDDSEDQYTKDKMDNLIQTLAADCDKNRNVAVENIELPGQDFLTQFFWALNLIQLISLKLGRYYSTASRDLISETSGNGYYHSETIDREQKIHAME
ncbi:SIS domain-containing protein [Kitasatospora sp. NPDC059827]|uniref:SIS domain-containing protein n=1 Tax=Kitasatospora sp. NPDC059827 TaxID=3346964 RepID=UPI003662943D